MLGICFTMLFTMLGITRTISPKSSPAASITTGDICNSESATLFTIFDVDRTKDGKILLRRPGIFAESRDTSSEMPCDSLGSSF